MSEQTQPYNPVNETPAIIEDIPERSKEINSLALKIVKVITSTNAIKKNGRNSQQGYDYAESSDLLEMVRKSLAENKVIIFPSLENKMIDNRTNPGGKTILVTVAFMQYTIVDAESGQYITVRYQGEGMDSGDKGLPKALTMSLKYFLRDQFLIPFGEDAENDKQNGKPEQKKEAGKKEEEHKEETNSKKLSEYQDTVMYIVEKKLGFAEVPMQFKVLNFILSRQDIDCPSKIDRDMVFKFYASIDNLLGRKVQQGEKRSTQDYKIIREKIDELMKPDEEPKEGVK